MMPRRGRHRRSQRAETRNYRARRSDRQETIQRFLIVCEGEKTEPSYLGSFRGPALVLDIRGFGINPRKLVDKALELGEEGEYEQVWCVFDRDECDVGDFNSALDRARSQEINVAYSNQAFELWYMLHYDFHNTAIPRQDYGRKLSKSLGREYRKNDPNMYDLLSSLQETAIQNAERLLGQYSPPFPAVDDPSTTVHKLVKELNRFLPETRANLE
jgi:hypothetical protein